MENLIINEQNNEEDDNDGFIAVQRKHNRNSHFDPYDVAINQFLEQCGLKINMPNQNSEQEEESHHKEPQQLQPHQRHQEEQQQTPLVIISRGVPGCGKSYLSRKIESASKALNRPCYICSADKFFEQSGQYIFDGSKLGEAHGFCRDSFQKALLIPNAVIIVDNTNTTKWEYKHYIQDAAEYGAIVKIVEIVLPINKLRLSQGKGAGGKGQGKGGPMPLPPKTRAVLQACASRNTHRVPFDAIEKMFRRWEDDETSFCVPVGGL